MALVYFLYGLSVFSLGVALSLQARSPFRILPKRSVWHLCAFGLVHGVSQWADGAVWAADRGFPFLGAEALKQAAPPLTALSFLFLLGFGFEALGDLGALPRSSRRAFPALLAAWGVLSALELGGAFSPRFYETLSRAALAFPASLLAAYALRRAGRAYDGTYRTRLGSYLDLSAAAFLAYSILAGPLFVPPGTTVLILRATCLVVAAGLLSEAFVVEADIRHSHLDRLRQQFVAMVAHDLRTPLAAADLSLQMMEQEASQGPGPGSAADRLGILRRSLDAIARLTGDFFDAAVLDSEGVSLNKERLELVALVSETVGHPRELGGRSIRLVPDAGAAWVEADPVRVRQILDNLLSNAVKYSEAGSSILVKVEAGRTEAVVSVVNQGPGIPKEEQGRLFEPFSRTREGERRAPGTGLGLYIVRRLVERQAGRVWVESAPRGPTVFSFSLPLSRAA